MVQIFLFQQGVKKGKQDVRSSAGTKLGTEWGVMEEMEEMERRRGGVKGLVKCEEEEMTRWSWF